MTPQRIQLRRVKGWHKPVGAVIVARPSKWGNPFRVGQPVRRESALWPYLARTVPGGAEGFDAIDPRLPEIVVDAFLWWLYEQPVLMLSLPELRGRDLACWCPIGEPCHGDALLELANEAAL